MEIPTMTGNAVKSGSFIFPEPNAINHSPFYLKFSNPVFANLLNGVVFPPPPHIRPHVI